MSMLSIVGSKVPIVGLSLNGRNQPSVHSVHSVYSKLRVITFSLFGEFTRK
jgi:hypothetical protein